MGESMISTNYMSQSLCSSDEESSWASYIEDFIATYPCGKENHETKYKTESQSDSLLLSGCRSSKKRKARATFVDHDLEDDASSPDHTPKQANHFSQLLTNSKNMIGSKRIFQEHNLFQKLNKQQQDDGGCSGTTSQGKENISDQNTEIYCTELRRKGLCLVHVSMLFK